MKKKRKTTQKEAVLRALLARISPGATPWQIRGECRSMGDDMLITSIRRVCTISPEIIAVEKVTGPFDVQNTLYVHRDRLQEYEILAKSGRV